MVIKDISLYKITFLEYTNNNGLGGGWQNAIGYGLILSRYLYDLFKKTEDEEEKIVAERFFNYLADRWINRINNKLNSILTKINPATIDPSLSEDLRYAVYAGIDFSRKHGNKFIQQATNTNFQTNDLNLNIEADNIFNFQDDLPQEVIDYLSKGEGSWMDIVQKGTYETIPQTDPVIDNYSITQNAFSKIQTVGVIKTGGIVLGDKICDFDTDQTLTGIKVFTKLPESTVVPTDTNQFTNKAYVDSKVVAPPPIDDLTITKNGSQQLQTVAVKTTTGKVDGDNICDLNTTQIISEVKTFTKLPESTVAPTTINQLVNKKYVDDKQVSTENTTSDGLTSTPATAFNSINGFAQGTKLTDILKAVIGGYNASIAVGDQYVKLTGEQSIEGKKTFTILPESSVVPTTANQLTNKAYVDSKVVAPVAIDDLTITKNGSQQLQTVAVKTTAGKVDGDEIATLNTSQTFSIKKTFTILPQSSAVPTVADDLTNKAYVDSKVGVSTTDTTLAINLASTPATTFTTITGYPNDTKLTDILKTLTGAYNAISSHLTSTYYTKIEIDNKFSLYYTKADIDAKLNGYYTKTDADSKFVALIGDQEKSGVLSFDNTGNNSGIEVNDDNKGDVYIGKNTAQPIDDNAIALFDVKPNNCLMVKEHGTSDENGVIARIGNPVIKFNRETDLGNKKITNLANGTNPTDAVNFSQLPNTSNFVDLTTAQNIAGVKTFTVLPESAVAPTTANQFTNKEYVDSKALAQLDQNALFTNASGEVSVKAMVKDATATPLSYFNYNEYLENYNKVVLLTGDQEVRGKKSFYPDSDGTTNRDFYFEPNLTVGAWDFCIASGTSNASSFNIWGRVPANKKLLFSVMHDIVGGDDFYGKFFVPLKMNNQKITDLGTPTANKDATTKEYVDGKLTAIDNQSLTLNTSNQAQAIGVKKTIGTIYGSPLVLSSNYILNATTDNTVGSMDLNTMTESGFFWRNVSGGLPTGWDNVNIFLFNLGQSGFVGTNKGQLQIIFPRDKKNAGKMAFRSSSQSDGSWDAWTELVGKNEVGVITFACQTIFEVSATTEGSALIMPIQSDSAGNVSPYIDTANNAITIPSVWNNLNDRLVIEADVQTEQNNPIVYMFLTKLGSTQRIGDITKINNDNQAIFRFRRFGDLAGLSAGEKIQIRVFRQGNMVSILPSSIFMLSRRTMLT